MLRIHAVAFVAPMANAHSYRDRPERSFVCEPMYEDCGPIYFQPTVAARVDVAFPKTNMQTDRSTRSQLRTVELE